MRNKLKAVRETVETIQAVQTLEYHDRNLLAGDIKTRAEWTLARLDEVVVGIGELECELIEDETRAVTQAAREIESLMADTLSSAMR